MGTRNSEIKTPSHRAQPSQRAVLGRVSARLGTKIQIGRAGYFQGVTGGTLSVAGGMSTVLKSAGLTISRYSMSGE